MGKNGIGSNIPQGNIKYLMQIYLLRWCPPCSHQRFSHGTQIPFPTSCTALFFYYRNISAYIVFLNLKTCTVLKTINITIFVFHIGQAYCFEILKSLETRVVHFGVKRAQSHKFYYQPFCY